MKRKPNGRKGGFMNEIQKLIDGGIVKIWERYGYCRAYVRLEKILGLEYDGLELRKYFSRGQLENLTIYADIINGGWFVSCGTYEARDAAISILQSLM